MKKLLSLIIALVFVFALFALGMTSYAEDEDNRWSGKYEELKSSDGTVTQIFENGSVRTTYPDGSREGLDCEGNRFTEDVDGKKTAYYADGTIGTQYPDGKEEYVDPTGIKFVIDKDGTMVSTDPMGLCTEYDEKGTATAMFFESGGKKVTLDENGDLPTGKGEIKGKNGEKLSWNHKEKDGVTNYSYTVTANDQTASLEMNLNGDGSGTINIKRFDGLTVNSLCDSEGNVTGFISKGDFSAKIDLNADGSGTVSNSLGDSTTVDKNGNYTIRTADGLYARFGENTDAFEFRDTESGSEIIVNSRGELVRIVDVKPDGSRISYENGTLEVKTADGKILTSTEDYDGKATITTSNGTVYTVDKDGNVTKNGEPVTGLTEPEKDLSSTEQGKTPSVNNQLKEDEKYLKSLGYTVYTMVSDMDKFESSIHADPGSLTGYLTATGPEADGIIIYYFKTASQAKKCSNEYYELVGTRLVYGDQYGVITGNKKDDEGPDAQMAANKAKLESLGYRVDLYTTNISMYEMQIGAKSGSLKGYLYAFRSSDGTHDSSLIQIFYLDTKSNASACFAKYGLGKLVDYAIVRGDDDGVIK